MGSASKIGHSSSAAKSSAKKEDSGDSDEDDDDDDDMFKGRMGYEDFMKKIEKHQKDIFK